jgi:hypothetical protein
VDLLTVVLMMLYMIFINIESNSSEGGFIDGRIMGASYGINQHFKWQFFKWIY